MGETYNTERRAQMLDVVRDLGSYGSDSALVIDGHRVTYDELAEQVRETQRHLRGLGIGRGSRLGLLTPNTATAVCLLLAAWDLGAVVVPLNARYRSHELRYVVGHSEIDVLFTAALSDGFPDFGDRLISAFPALKTQRDPHGLALPEAPALRSIVILGPAPTEAAFMSEECFRASVEPGQAQLDAVSANDEQLLIYTSGTTAHPKGVVHSLDEFCQQARRTAQVMGIHRGDVIWDPLPLFHVGGLVMLIGTLGTGAAYVTSAHFEAGQTLALLAKERVTAAYAAFPTLINPLLDHPEFASTDLTALRWILAVGPDEQLARVQRELPAAVQVSCFGMTETCGPFAYHDITDSPAVRASTVGRPFPGVEVRLVSRETGSAPPPGLPGEIQVRGVAVLRGYYRDPRPSVDADGWFVTGDIGRFDENGRLVYIGRSKDMFKVGGENVAAAEIESVLAQHPAVTLAQVVSAPDARLTEVAAAFVELKPGRHVDVEELRDFCADRLASFKVPRYVRIVTEWPMSATKVQKFKLRERILEELAESSATPAAPQRSV